MKQMLSTLVIVLLLAGGTAWAQQNPAEKLMTDSHLAYYYAGDGGSAKVKMVLTNKKGKTREREFWMLRRDIKDLGNQNYYTYFTKPGDVAGTAFLVHKHAEGNDDRWLYIPAIDLVKRIAADDRSSSFVGSDFSYEDVSGRLPILDNHEIVGADSVMGRATIEVKSTPKDAKTAEWAYRLSWIDNETKLPLKEEYFNKKGVAIRRFEAGKIETIEGFPTAVERTMYNLKRKQHTTISFGEISYKTPMKADEFNERLLKNPPREYTR